MKRKLAELIPWIAVIAGGFVAQRAFAGDGTATAAAAGAASVFDSLSQHPAFLGFCSWLMTELSTRAFPTLRKTSTFFFLAAIFDTVGVFFFALKKICLYVADHPFAQNQRPAPDRPPEEPPKGGAA